MTEILRPLGVMERAILEFEVHRRGELCFARVIDAGAWRPDNDYGLRARW